MKHDFKKMEEEMDKLAANMSTITEFSEKITGTLQGKRQQITKLSGVHALLKKVLCFSVWFSDIIVQVTCSVYCNHYLIFFIILNNVSTNRQHFCNSVQQLQFVFLITASVSL